MLGKLRRVAIKSVLVLIVLIGNLFSPQICEVLIDFQNTR